MKTTMMPFREVPIFVNSFNRLTCLRRLLEWLCAAGHRRIFVIDNASTYPPLLDYLGEVERHHLATVIRLPENVGHLAIWACGLLDRLGITSEYVYTDPRRASGRLLPPGPSGVPSGGGRRESRDPRSGAGPADRRHPRPLSA